MPAPHLAGAGSSPPAEGSRMPTVTVRRLIPASGRKPHAHGHRRPGKLGRHRDPLRRPRGGLHPDLGDRLPRRPPRNRRTDTGRAGRRGPGPAAGQDRPAAARPDQGRAADRRRRRPARHPLDPRRPDQHRPARLHPQLTFLKESPCRITSVPTTSSSPGILAVEAYHAANIRTILYDRGLAAAPTPSPPPASPSTAPATTQRITRKGHASIIPADANGLAFSRTPARHSTSST